MGAEWVSLHTHTDNSILDGFATVDEYIARATAMGQRGIGVTDHGDVHALYDLLTEAPAANLTPVPGCEFYVAPQNPLGARCKTPVFYADGGREDVSQHGAYLHLSVWAVTDEGLHNLMALSSLSFRPEHFYKKPRIDIGMLADHADGLVVATGCPSSEVSTRLLAGQSDEALAYAGRLADIFPGRTYVEVMRHRMTHSTIEKRLLPMQLDLAAHLNLPLLATNDSHYASPGDALSHEQMLCSQANGRMNEKTINEGGKRFAFDGDDYYLRSAAEMEKLFPPDQFPGALSSTLDITEQAQDIHLAFDPTLKPVPRTPPEYPSEDAYYQHLISAGLDWRYGDSSPEVQAEARRRAQVEYEVIHSSNFVGYMLVVRDYLTWTRKHFSTCGPDGKVLALPVGVGRGSVGGSIHAYVLGISEIDPIRYDLLFERFLSAGRGETYELTYSDGSTERIVASDQKTVLDMRNKTVQRRYIHQLAVGDVVAPDEAPPKTGDTR